MTDEKAVNGDAQDSRPQKENVPSTTDSNGNTLSTQDEKDHFQEDEKHDEKPAETEDKGKKDKKNKKGDEKDKPPPAGGFSKTPIPKGPQGYTVKFTFHRAEDLPVADMQTMSSDPFILATLTTDLPTRHKEDPPMRFRTPTVRRNCSPEWNAEWIVAGIPPSGFDLKLDVLDEDPADHDDRIGTLELSSGNIGENWKGINEQTFEAKYRALSSKRAYLWRVFTMCFSGKKLHGRIIISAQLLGKTEGEGGRVYTVGPNYWTQHFSPLIGKLAGTKAPEEEVQKKLNNDNDKNKAKKEREKSNFQANQIQLKGPIPAEMYHRYVEFKPFVKGMFSKTGFRGHILNFALHKQHNRIYNYDRSTIYGKFEEPCRDMTRQFLDLVHYDQGGRIYTYVLSLDALWRFTETGKEFGIDLLSKHTMHSDVSLYIAFSGEFFIRRLEHPNESITSPDQETHPPDPLKGGPPETDPPKDPKNYELVIDNDSGTYRPNKDLLPILQQYLEENLPGLRVLAKACDDEELIKMKKEQKETKKSEVGDVQYTQMSRSGSVSSSDLEQIDNPNKKKKKKFGMEQAVAAAEDPKKAMGDMIPMEKGRFQREKRETREDEAAEHAEAGQADRSPSMARLS